MEILYILLVLLIATRAFGEVAVRVGQPALVGELLAGVLLGIVVTRNRATFPVLADLPGDPVFAAITDLGIFFLMLMAGLELRPKKLAEASPSPSPRCRCRLACCSRWASSTRPWVG